MPTSENKQNQLHSLEEKDSHTDGHKIIRFMKVLFLRMFEVYAEHGT